MPERFTSQITVDKNIVSLLSKFTYERSLPYAIREVISNSYDADATIARVDIDLKRERIVISDNGNGMTREEFQFFLRIAGQRRGKSETPKFGRRRIGQFGVGFLAILPFCETLQIRSTTENSEELFTAEIPAARFFKNDGNAVDVGDVDVPGQIERSARLRTEHFTEISLLQLSSLATRYLTQKPQTDDKSRVASWPVLERLKWEMQEDLPLAFPPKSGLNEILAYPESIGMEVYLQGNQLYRNYSDGEVLQRGEETVGGITFRYAIVSPWKGVRPFDLRGVKMRLNNIGVGRRENFGIDITRQYSRLHWLSGELQILRGLDTAITLSRDAFLAIPEYEAMREKMASILRKSAFYVESVDVAAREMTKQVRGGKQAAVAAKKTIVERNLKTLTDRGFTVTRVAKQDGNSDAPVKVNRARREVTVYEEHPGLEDTIAVGKKKYKITYVRDSIHATSYEDACRINAKGEIEINAEYRLFRSKRYGDIFKKVCIIAAIARLECSSPDKMYSFILSQMEREFTEF
ncbi:MAG: ATP-binding protein [Acidobacteriaceae bacterium]|jgi:hypothetical protein